VQAIPALSTTWAASRHSFLRRVEVIGFLVGCVVVVVVDGGDVFPFGVVWDGFDFGGSISENIPPKHWTRRST